MRLWPVRNRKGPWLSIVPASEQGLFSYLQIDFCFIYTFLLVLIMVIVGLGRGLLVFDRGSLLVSGLLLGDEGWFNISIQQKQ